MSEVRRDPITGQWVVIAPERADRPICSVPDIDFFRADFDDPFVAGREHDTPGETFAVRDPGSPPNGPGWKVRVVPNKFPALKPTAAPPPAHDDFFARNSGFGRHEVIIECPHGETNLARLSVAQVADVLGAYRERLRALADDSRFRHALIFKNHGPAAGASLPHSHSQLFATPFVLPMVAEELAGAERYHRAHGRCVFADLLARELSERVRIVAETDEFVAICPFASRFPYEIWLVPRRTGSRFERVPAEHLPELAALLKDVLERLADTLNEPAYNYVIHSAPFDGSRTEYRWHIEIMPRLTGLAGLELGGGTYVNVIAPEDAAEQLRQFGVR